MNWIKFDKGDPKTWPDPASQDIVAWHLGGDKPGLQRVYYCKPRAEAPCGFFQGQFGIAYGGDKVTHWAIPQSPEESAKFVSMPREWSEQLSKDVLGSDYSEVGANILVQVHKAIINHFSKGER